MIGKGIITATFVLACITTGSAQPVTAQPDSEAGQVRTWQLPASMVGQAEIEAAIAARAWDRAAQLIAAEVERTPGRRELYALAAQVFLLDRKPLNAAIAIKKAEALGPIDDRLRFSLALAYVAMGRGDWARPELERLAAGRPEDMRYPYWLARLDYDAGRYAAAIARLERVVAREPDFVRAYDNLALCYDAQHDAGRARAAHVEAVRRNRLASAKSPWPPLNYGSFLMNLGELAEAESLLREAVQYDEELAPAHHALGTLLERTGRLDEAVAELSRAATVDPAYPEPHYALARIHRRKGRVAEADAALATFRRLQELKEEQRQP
ncbi:MAG TPA: tetratricopeptide repeat protein [Vicinamibacterales bacterium]